MRLLQGVEDCQSFALRERLRVIAVRQEDRLTELGRALLQRAGPAAQADEPLPQGTATQERRVAQAVHHAARALVRVDHPAVGVEHHHTLAERLQHRLAEGREGERRWNAGSLVSLWHI